MKRLLTAAAAAVASLAGPLAHAADSVRASAPVAAANEMGGGLPLSVIIVLLTVLGGAIYLAVDDDDGPDSP